MTLTKDLTDNNKKERQLKACLVTDPELFENLQRDLVDTSFLILFRERLMDLIKDAECNLYIVDTKVEDIDTWPVPLLAVPNAQTKDWLFIISRLSDTLRIQPLPQNARFLDRKYLSTEKVVSLIRKQLGPQARKKFARVMYLEDIRVFLVWMENEKTYALRISDLPEADSSKIVKWSISTDRSYIKAMQESGNTFEIPWDDVLYHCEPQYEFYKGKRVEDEDVGARRIGEKVRQLRESKGYSVKELADRVGMKRPNLSRLEHGRHQPSLETLERIAEALETSVAGLIAKRSLNSTTESHL